MSTAPTPHCPSPAHDLGARMDRLRLSRMHTTIMLALGAGWLFDSSEVQLFSNAIGPLGATFHASVTQQDAVLAVWLGGILIGAMAGGVLTDRFGRRRMFVLTLLWYAGFTVLTGLSPNLDTVYVLRFLAALGVGAEYAIVNAAIAEFMPAKVRGRVGVAVMNFWPAGAVLAALLAYLLLDTLALQASTSWRYLFVFGGLLALIVLWFRRRIPESPRWLASQGRVEEAQQIVAHLEEQSGAHPKEPDSSALRSTTHQDIAPAEPVRVSTGQALRELLHRYPGRLALGACLDLAEAFGYYGIFALLSVVVLAQVHIGAAQIPFFYIVGNLGAVAGGLIAARLVDTAGRRNTVAGAYLAGAAGVALLAAATATGSPLWVTLAFVVSNGAGTAAWTSAYPTFTELFPTHLRGVGVGMSVGVGRIGAIVGTLLLPTLATDMGPTASYTLVIVFWLIGAGAMVAYRWRGGMEAANQPLEVLAPEPVAAHT